MKSLIPYFPTLGIRSGWRARSRRGLPYPLGHERIRRYFMGRSGIYHGVASLGLKPGDEVLMPSYHSGTEAAPLLHFGCRLAFYGVARDLSIDLNEVERKIGPDTRALYAIHFIGFPAPVAELRDIANRRGLVFVEDCAQAFLSRTAGRPLGTWGDMSVFCLYKSLPVAAGAILALNGADPLPPEPRPAGLYSELNLTVKHVFNSLSLHGGVAGAALRWLAQRLAGGVVASAKIECVTPESMSFDPSVLDWGLGPITARLLGWLDFDAIAARRRQNYRWLANRLAEAGLTLVRDELPDDVVPLFLPILVPDKFDAVARLRREKIMAVPFWGVHHGHLPRGEFPDTEYLVNHVVELPIYQDLTRSHLQRIADSAVRFVRPMPPRRYARLSVRPMGRAAAATAPAAMAPAAEAISSRHGSQLN